MEADRSMLLCKGWSCEIARHLLKFCPEKRRASQPQPSTSNGTTEVGTRTKDAKDLDEWKEMVKRGIKCCNPASPAGCPT